MPPKKRTPKAKVEPKDVSKKDPETENGTKQEDEEPSAAEAQESETQPPPAAKDSKKRKKANGDNDTPQKAARRSGRGAPKSEASTEQLLDFMLSKDAEELCRPDDESEDIKSRGDIKTYSSSVLSPFEELLCAVILSRPISHRLGLRSIRTILNDPYNFTSARAIQKAGGEKQHQALWDARTQHKAKTAEQIGLIADVVLEKFTKADDKDGTKLGKVLEESGDDVGKARDSLKESIKGLGKTGLDIFFRRVQWLWDAAYPYIDDRTMDSLRNVGLPREGEELQKLIEQHWSKLDTKNLAGDDEAAKKRRAFVLVLERATGSDLEGKTDALVSAAASP